MSIGNAPPAAVTRRALRFRTVDDALAEADRLATAGRAGRLARAGSWSLGQALGHLATWAEFAFDGYPDAARPPLPVRLIVRMLKGKFLHGAMPAGIRMRGVSGGTLGTGDLPTEEGLRRFQSALTRLREQAPTIRNPLFGSLSHTEWIELNLRHAELHLGFFVPTDPTAAP